MFQYAECGHLYQQFWNRCTAALARPDQAICIPITGHTRDLPQELDVQDRNRPGRCPACTGMTPPSSAGSQG